MNNPFAFWWLKFRIERLDDYINKMAEDRNGAKKRALHAQTKRDALVIKLRELVK